MGLKAYPAELRTRIVAAVAGGLSRAEVARRFTVDVRTVRRYLTQQRQTGEQGVRVSVATMSRVQRGFGITVKTNGAGQ